VGKVDGFHERRPNTFHARVNACATCAGKKANRDESLMLFRGVHGDD
jgi:hypothetical protein